MEQTYIKNYTEKIKTKQLLCEEISNENVEDINALIIFINYCFNKKNNFFVKNFNKKNIGDLYMLYNKLKTNIFTSDIKDIFDGISIDGLKCIKFIMVNFNFHYDKIIIDNDLCGIISKESSKNIIQILENQIKSK